MSVDIPTRCDVTAHLQCLLCGHFSKSHAHQLAHTAASHPVHLDSVVVGRLGNMLMYQSTARLFHCSACFYTSREFSKLYKHIITKHCTNESQAGGGAEGEEGAVERDTALKTKRSSEEEEEDEAADNDEDQSMDPKKPDGEGEKVVLMFNGSRYRCVICGWQNKLKAHSINHMVRKHGVPKAFAMQAVRRDVANKQALSVSPEEEEEPLSEELLKKELEATAKVIRFISNRFVCLICGWKTKLKGFAISHIMRSHDVERPFACRTCRRSFFLPSRLQQHVRAAHRPGRYACPFCCFRSHFLGGFKRHCSRCNAREEEQEEDEEDLEEEERKKRGDEHMKREEEEEQREEEE
ncbi:uncharacterized protein LOC143000691 [Genypterus blacodes]|uniref:uncharacterized protein LOC143000691 n=1 Tax=Genypterus blacodes TaxID=154954 RepID=UPI003F76CB15